MKTLTYGRPQRRMLLDHRDRDPNAPDYVESFLRLDLRHSKPTKRKRRFKEAREQKERMNRLERLFRSPKKKRSRPKALLDLNETELIASICRDSFYEFVKEFWSTVVAEEFQDNWHIKYLCDELQVMAERIFAREKKAYDLAVNIAPGSTKSLIMSVMFPMWCWTRMPSFRFIGASYSFPLAMDLSLKSRDIAQSEKYRACFPEVKIREDQNTKGYFRTINGGFRYAVGVNGAVLGMHAHFIVIDDPLNPQEALSSADIASANHWIKHTLSTRKVDKRIACMALVMQRLHQDDPTSQFLTQKRVKHICLPAEIEEGIEPNLKPIELRMFYKKGLMDANRLSKEVLKEEKDKGEYYYSAQFRQDPVPAGGGMFKTKRLKVGQVPNQFRTLVRYWDKAGTLGGGTYTVGTKIGQDMQGKFWVLNVVRVQLDSFEREKLIEEVAEADGPQVQIGIEQEPGSGGKESAEASVRNLAGFKVRIIKVDATTGGKVERADPWSVQMNAGNVYLPEDMKNVNAGQGSDEWQGWAKEWVEEHRYFPYSKYKDQVDSASGAFSLCHKKRIRVGGLDPSYQYSQNSYTPTQMDRIRRLRKGQYRNTKARAISLGRA